MLVVGTCGTNLLPIGETPSCKYPMGVYSRIEKLDGSKRDGCIWHMAGWDCKLIETLAMHQMHPSLLDAPFPR